MQRTIEHIYELKPDEVIEAFRWYLTYRQLRMPEDDKRCSVKMNVANGATVIFVEEVQETESQRGELIWAEHNRMGAPPKPSAPNLADDGFDG